MIPHCEELSRCVFVVSVRKRQPARILWGTAADGVVNRPAVKGWSKYRYMSEECYQADIIRNCGVCACVCFVCCVCMRFVSVRACVCFVCVVCVRARVCVCVERARR